MAGQVGIIDETGYLAYEGQGFDALTEEQKKSIDEQKKKENTEE